MALKFPKSAPVRSEKYRRLVAAMPCARCLIDGMSQAAHADMGKGMSIKSDDRTCYPLCWPCHGQIGASGTYPKARRRELEARYGAETRARIEEAGDWPAGLARM